MHLPDTQISTCCLNNKALEKSQLLLHQKRCLTVSGFWSLLLVCLCFFFFHNFVNQENMLPSPNAVHNLL